MASRGQQKNDSVTLLEDVFSSEDSESFANNNLSYLHSQEESKSKFSMLNIQSLQ